MYVHLRFLQISVMHSTVNGTEEIDVGSPCILWLARRQMNLMTQSHLQAQRTCLSIIHLNCSGGVVFLETEKNATSIVLF